MLNTNAAKIIPNVLCLAGLDPTGGAGLQADIEAIASIGAHACPVATSLTVQNTNNVIEVKPVEGDFLLKQAKAVFNDMPIACIKIGLLADPDSALAVAELLLQHPDIPVILDPVLRAGGGSKLNHDDTRVVLLEKILPLCTLVTPNLPEAQQLSGQRSRAQCADFIIKRGSTFVLITGTHDEGETVVNSLYGPEGLIFEHSWPRLPNNYHGSGCTLSSAIAGLLATGISMDKAVIKAQKYTWETLQNGYATGQGQHVPQRFYWKPNDII